MSTTESLGYPLQPGSAPEVTGQTTPDAPDIPDLPNNPIAEEDQGVVDGSEPKPIDHVAVEVEKPKKAVKKVAEKKATSSNAKAAQKAQIDE